MSLAMAIQDICSREGVEFRSDYSGRGMYGKTCVGITGSISDLVVVVTGIASEMAYYDLSPEDIESLAEISKDSMGYDSIFYWEGIDGDDDDIDGDDDDEEEE